LHAVSDEQRKRLIPNNFGFSIENILNAGRYYLKKTKSRLTIEYVLIKGINDSVADAHKLTRLLRYHKLLNPNVQVNLISLNSIVDTQFKIPTKNLIQKFKSILRLNGIAVNVRQVKGSDINAACGQLGY
jgi:23S rRNA (adenine2503-C2)-methyltransferase